MQELLQKIQFEDDQQAFGQLYQLLFFKLYQFAYAFLRSKENSEEIVNDVFLGLWHKRHALNTISNINVYLYVSIKNASLNYLRKHKSMVPASIDDLTVSHLSFKVNPEILMISKEMKTRISLAIDQLPPRCKMVFKLVKEDGLSYKEVAEILHVSVKTVDTQLYLALKKLAHSLLPLWNEYKNADETDFKNPAS